MRRTRRTFATLSILVALAVGLAACGTDTDEDLEDPGGSDSPEDPAEDTPDGEEGPDGDDIEVRLSDSTLELLVDGGELAAEFTLDDGVFHSFLVTADSTPNNFDAAVLALHGERPVFWHLSWDGVTASLDEFPDHLQPAHEVDASPPTFAFTPDGRSLVWTEPIGAGVVLRSVGWDDGPGTGNPADDNASFELDAPADVHVDGFEPIDDTTWILLLRNGAGSDPIELEVERQADGALALP